MTVTHDLEVAARMQRHVRLVDGRPVEVARTPGADGAAMSGTSGAPA